MSVSENKQFKPVFTKEEIDDLTKKYYGLGETDLDEIYAFINGFEESMVAMPENANYDNLKDLVDKCNKIPAHCGFIVMSYFVNNHGDDAFNKVMMSVYMTYKSLFEEDPESTKTTDLYETLACMIAFAPSKTIRKFITEKFEVSKDIYVLMRKRPGTDAAMSARYAELFVTSKFDKKYSDLIYDNYNAMLNYLASQEWDIADISDPVGINFNQLKAVMQDYFDRNKKESLKKINKLINKKGDIGEAFFYFVALNPSCAMEVLFREDRFNSEFIQKFLCQLKVQYVAELVAIIENLPEEKMGFMNYVKDTYKIEDIDGCYEKLANIVRKEGMATYGTLLRQVSFFPTIDTKDEEKFDVVADRLISKLSSVANNLTADISEKSMSITIVPLGRSRIYQDIMDKIEGFDEGNANSFVAKMRDKDLIKKIRESWLSWFTLDQACGAMMIAILQTMSDIYNSKPDIDVETMTKEVYRILVLKHGMIMTLPYFRYIVDGLLDKQVVEGQDDGAEDYEDIG